MLGRREGGKTGEELKVEGKRNYEIVSSSSNNIRNSRWDYLSNSMDFPSTD